VKRNVILSLFLFVTLQSFAKVQVATVLSWGEPSWPELSILSELNNNWSLYGSTPLAIDTSLHSVSSFTFEDLQNTGADVIWLSDCAGGGHDFTPDEEDALKLYVQQGHSIFGTFAVFQHPNGQDNRELAPLFGLRKDLDYVALTGSPNSTTFYISIDGPLFHNVSNPYVSSGFPYGFVPSNDQSWNLDDLGGAQFVAKTPDNCGVITWFQSDLYHAIYVSEMIEYQSTSTDDAQFIYNALTIPEPTTLVMLGLGSLALLRRRRV
jgi:hypothetical protein